MIKFYPFGKKQINHSKGLELVTEGHEGVGGTVLRLDYGGDCALVKFRMDFTKCKLPF